MAKQWTTKWRESASLIILARDTKFTHKHFDYKVLLFNRPEKASFFAKSTVFPGGVHESSDEAPQWLEHFNKFGVSAEKLKELVQLHGPRPSIYSKHDGHGHGEDSLRKEISLRITAVRETFEEVGILICRNGKSLSGSSSAYGNFLENFDRKYWQHLVHNDHTQFLTLCRELNVVPDLWNLHEWSAWLTPSSFKKRFETAFYLVALEETPDVILEENEVDNYAWMTPIDYLTANFNNKLWLPPPQFYEISRLLNFAKLEQLQAFARQRATNGTTLMLPVQYRCTDGSVSMYPGDDMYPSDPNAFNEIIPINKTMEKFRSCANNVHRTEYVERNTAKLHLNFKLLDGQLCPLNSNDIREKL